ncbi:reverse transcriptase domain-containing protein [Tanacetum coccineum]|uniref:Reverse transcriptase domain-containing protein n=1 Tax=Tanacetum coccineum TaxID=301880 RepID=A0ABQ5G5J3_9ASTR
MAREDEENTAFYTDQGTYCYTKMPFGLRNALTTYPRLVDSAFQSQIGRNLEAYVDDMVIKSNDEKMPLANIAETFDNLRRINMKLNPKKCSYGVEEGKFLGYMVTSKGIRENHKKIRALADLPSPRIVSVILMIDRKGKQCPIHYEIETILRGLPDKGAYNILFEPRNAVKGQVLADFISEAPNGEPTKSYFRTPEVMPERGDTEKWTLVTDGASSLKGFGAGLVLICPSGVEYTYALRLTFTNTNNEAEYKALLAGLRIARKIKIQNLEANVDSKLVASQINKSYVASSDNMIKYQAKEYIACFKSLSIQNIPRNLN